MSTSTIICVSRRELLLSRLLAYLELTKPRIGALVLVVVAASALVGGGAVLRPLVWTHLLLGTALVAASASTFNQLRESASDSHMERTAGRPLPAARLQPSQVVAFGAATLLVGLAQLGTFVNAATACLGMLTWLLYVLVYTPLKSRTPANTAIGAIAGALPVLIGWAAADAPFSLSGGSLPGGIRAAAFFLIVYLWQFPHFMAIAWIYRRQYAAAGLKMLTVVDPTGRRAGAQSVVAALALLPISLLPLLRPGHSVFPIAAVALGAAYLFASATFCWRRDDVSARRLLQISLIYLPALLALLVLSPIS